MINKNTRNSNGFSFVELMVVIALIGLLSAIGLPSLLRNLPEKRLKNAARNLYADIQKVRLLAVKENVNITMIFNEATGQYSYMNGGTTITESLSDYGAVQYGCDVTSKNSWRESPDDSFPPSGITGNIEFSNLGNANAGDIYLQSENDQTVCYAVEISMFGTAKIWRYNGSTWE